MRLTPRQVNLLAVWIDMLEADGPVAAGRAASIFSPFPHVAQFHDPERSCGAAVAASIGAPGHVAWDIYLFFDAASQAAGKLPRPRDWAHQLSERDWADPDRFHWDQALPVALRTKMESLLTSEQSGAP